MAKLTKEQVLSLMKLEDLLLNGVYYCTINGGSLYRIINVINSEEEFDYGTEYGSIEEFLKDTDIDNLESIGIEVTADTSDFEYTEPEFYSFIDNISSYYDLELYTLNQVEWRN